MLRQRLILGPILIAAIIVGSWFDEAIDRVPVPSWLPMSLFGDDTLPPGVIAFFVCVVLSLLGSIELARILRDKGIGVSIRVMSFAAVCGLIVQALVPSWADGLSGSAVTSAAATVVLVTALVFHARNRSVEGVVGAAGGTLLAYVYLGLMLGFIVAIRREHSAWLLLWVLVSTKACDIGAYFSGRAIGKHKLIPWLSPGKTWEGLMGGVVLSALVGGLGALLLGVIDPDSPISAWFGAIAGVIFGVVGQAGDLMASLFKRDAGIKDAGDVLPGFGGVLDVLDSLLLVLPVAYWITKVGMDFA